MLDWGPGAERMSVENVAGRRRRPVWRRVAVLVFSAYLTLTAWGCLLLAAFALPGASMRAGHVASPGVVITGTFAYLYHPAKGPTVDIPITVTADSGPRRVVIDYDRFFPDDPTDATDVGPFGAGGPGYVTLPEEVMLSHDSSRGYVAFTTDRPRLVLQVPSPVGWKGRLLVAVPPALTLAGLGIAILMFRSFLRSIFEGQPFHPKNPGRLLWLAGALVVAIVADWLRGWIGQAVLDVLAEHGHGIPLAAQNPGINPVPLVIVLAVVSLAWAFRVGTRLATDADGLV